MQGLAVTFQHDGKGYLVQVYLEGAPTAAVSTRSHVDATHEVWTPIEVTDVPSTTVDSW